MIVECLRGECGEGPRPVDSATVRFTGAAAVAGDIATVEVILADDQVGLVGLQFDVDDPTEVLTLRSQDDDPPGAELGLDAELAGKTLTVAPVAGGTRITVFALDVEPIPDGDGDGVKTVATLRFNVAAGAMPACVEPQYTTVVVTDNMGRSNNAGGGLNVAICPVGAAIQ